MTTRRFLLPLLVLLVAPMAWAESVSAPMTVSATVVARAKVTVESQPLAVDVTSADIERGYVDVEAPIVLRIQTNSRRGYLLQLAKSNDSFSEVEVSFGDTAIRVASHESWIQRPYVSGGDSIAMRARLRLSPAAQPGRHALPIEVSASPL